MRCIACSSRKSPNSARNQDSSCELTPDSWCLTRLRRNGTFAKLPRSGARVTWSNQRVRRSLSKCDHFRVRLSRGIVRCAPATRFGWRLLLAARTLIKRAVLHSVWRLHLHPRLFIVEGLSGLVSRRDLLVPAVAERDLLSWHKNHLPDW